LTELTRRQLRELERAGQLPEQSISVSDASGAPNLTVTLEPVVSSIPVVSLGLNADAVVEVDSDRPLTRREMRLRAEAESTNTSQISTVNRAAALAKSLAPADIEVAAPQIEAQQAEPLRRFEVPAVGLRRSQRAVPQEPRVEQSTDFMEVVDVEIPEDGLRGANYLGEPSTQSIVLEVAPEAISLATDTGEVFTTGSIAILPDTTGSTTGALDGIDLDSEEAVTGVISVVDPVSARDLIDQRSPLGVVPSNVLRKGWWRPWAVGALSVAMAIAAILASITIFNALGD
jgi:hypothetical protein